MPYTDFSLESAESRLGLAAGLGDLFPGLRPLPVPRDSVRMKRRITGTNTLSNSEGSSTMRVASVLLVVSGLMVFSQPTARGQDSADGKEAKTKAVERYLKLVPMRALMEDMTEAMAKNMPPAKATELRELLTKNLDIKALEDATRESMLKHFTAKEINALADFYGSPEGRSIMKKFGVYMAELQPVIQREILKAAGK